MRTLLFIAALSFAIAENAYAQEQDADQLAHELANPISSLISVPFEFNADHGAGADGDGWAYALNIQPVVPTRLNNDWNLISRTIIPVLARDDVFPTDNNVWGLGDIVQSFFFSPEKPGPGGLIWGVGPAFLLPTATDDKLGSQKWGIGPTFAGLTQRGHWTVGVLVNHIWSVAGDDNRDDVNATYIQPFSSYALGHGQSLHFGAEATYDWKTDQWNAPVTASYSWVFAIGQQRVSLDIGGRYFAAAPEGGPDWGLRTTLTLLFPRR